MAFEDDENGPEDIRKAEKRKTFQRNLEEQGLELELEPSHVNRSYIVMGVGYPENRVFGFRISRLISVKKCDLGKTCLPQRLKSTQKRGFLLFLTNFCQMYLMILQSWACKKCCGTLKNH